MCSIWVITSMSSIKVSHKHVHYLQMVYFSQVYLVEVTGLKQHKSLIVMILKFAIKMCWMCISVNKSIILQAKEQIEKESDTKTKELLLDLLDELYEELKSKDFHGSYFDRKAKSDRICDSKGWFKCEGAFDRKQCDKLHTINPYASRGYRQLFGLWNLDHM